MRHQKSSEIGKTKSSKTPNEASSGETTLHADPNSAQILREILSRNNMTLSQVSKESRKLFPGQSLYHIPHNLYFDLHHGRFTPNIYHPIALSYPSPSIPIHLLPLLASHPSAIPP